MAHLLFDRNRASIGGLPCWLTWTACEDPCLTQPQRRSPLAAPQKLSYEWAWAVPSVLRCGVRRRTPTEIAAALSGKRLVFIGDSHMRYMHNWLAFALGGEAGVLGPCVAAAAAVAGGWAC